jgi:alkanesulfonate monooxygenase SsuD/methylene tetrahydromethanopterin reductase-like flavin-dependent oxidoreductase (luciferase family)
MALVGPKSANTVTSCPEPAVRYGYGAGTGISGVDQVRDEAAWAAQAGFTSFWLSQVFGVDPIVALAAIGATVPEMAELGTSVVPLAGRHPLALAAQAKTAQSAMQGRFTLGIGTAHQMVVEGFFGESYAQPFSRVSEFLAALMPLLDGHTADVAGEQVFAKGWLTIDATHARYCLPLSAHGCWNSRDG